MQVCSSNLWHTGTCRATESSRAPPCLTRRQLRRTARCTGLVKAASVPCLCAQQKVHSIPATLLQHTASPWRFSAGAAQYRTVCARASGRTSCALAVHRAGLVASGELWGCSGNEAAEATGQLR